MTYTNLGKIKAWLRISDSTYDSELEEILSSVAKEVESLLGRFTQTPVSDPDIVDVLADIEAEWVAGVFRARRENLGREHPWVSEAKARLLDLIKTRYLTSFETA